MAGAGGIRYACRSRPAPRTRSRSGSTNIQVWRSCFGHLWSRSDSGPWRTVMPWRPWLTIIVWMLPVTVRAQSTLASVSGTIYDEQHAVLPGAAITLSSLDTGQTRSVGSDSAGRYRVLGLTPGRYEMRVALEGFAIDVQSDLLLTISAEAQRHVTLRVAGVSQAETVAGATPQVAISATALGRTISTREIDKLPVAARDFT